MQNISILSIPLPVVLQLTVWYEDDSIFLWALKCLKGGVGKILRDLKIFTKKPSIS